MATRPGSSTFFSLDCIPCFLCSFAFSGITVHKDYAYLTVFVGLPTIPLHTSRERTSAFVRRKVVVVFGPAQSYRPFQPP